MTNPNQTAEKQVDIKNDGPVNPAQQLGPMGGPKKLQLAMQTPPSGLLNDTKGNGAPQSTDPSNPADPKVGPIIPPYDPSESPSKWYDKIEEIIQSGKINLAQCRKEFDCSPRDLLEAVHLLQDFDVASEVAKSKGNVREKLEKLHETLDSINQSDDDVRRVTRELFQKAHDGQGPVSKFIEDNKLNSITRRNLMPDFEKAGFSGKPDIELVNRKMGGSFYGLETAEKVQKVSQLVNIEYVIDKKNQVSGEITEDNRQEIIKRIKDSTVKELFGELLPKGTTPDDRLRPLGFIAEEYGELDTDKTIAKAYTDLRLGLREARQKPSDSALAKANDALETLESNPNKAPTYYEAYNFQASRRVSNPGDLMNDLAKAGLGKEYGETSFKIASDLVEALADEDSDIKEAMKPLLELAQNDKSGARAVIIALGSGQMRDKENKPIDLNTILKKELSEEEYKEVVNQLPSLQIPIVKVLDGATEAEKQPETPDPTQPGRQSSQKADHKTPDSVKEAQLQVERQKVKGVMGELFKDQLAPEPKMPRSTLFSALGTTHEKKALIDQSLYEHEMGPVDLLMDYAHAKKAAVYQEFLGKVGNNRVKNRQAEYQRNARLKPIDGESERLIKSLYVLDNESKPNKINQFVVFDRATELKKAVADFRNGNGTVAPDQVFAALAHVENLPNEFKAMATTEEMAQKYEQQGLAAVDQVYELTDQLLSEPQMMQNQQGQFVEIAGSGLPKALYKALQNHQGGGLGEAASDIMKAYEISNDIVAGLLDHKAMKENPDQWKAGMQKQIELLTADDTSSRVSRMVLHRVLRDPDLRKFERIENGQIQVDGQGNKIMENAKLVSVIYDLFPKDADRYMARLFPDR